MSCVCVSSSWPRHQWWPDGVSVLVLNVFWVIISWIIVEFVSSLASSWLCVKCSKIVRTQSQDTQEAGGVKNKNQAFNNKSCKPRSEKIQNKKKYKAQTQKQNKVQTKKSTRNKSQKQTMGEGTQRHRNRLTQGQQGAHRLYDRLID